MKNILLAEGNSSFYQIVTNFLENNLNSYYNSLIPVSNIFDLIYHILYNDTVFDVIIIGDELTQTNPCLGIDKEMDFELEKLKKCEYFPVTLGEICRTFSKKAGKLEPHHICIMSRFEAYPFNVAGEESIEAFTKSHNMSFIDKTADGSEDFIHQLVVTGLLS